MYIEKNNQEAIKKSGTTTKEGVFYDLLTEFQGDNEVTAAVAKNKHCCDDLIGVFYVFRFAPVKENPRLKNHLSVH